jgi:hypothetical protein
MSAQGCALATLGLTGTRISFWFRWPPVDELHMLEGLHGVTPPTICHYLHGAMGVSVYFSVPVPLYPAA